MNQSEVFKLIHQEDFLESWLHSLQSSCRASRHLVNKTFVNMSHVSPAKRQRCVGAKHTALLANIVVAMLLLLQGVTADGSCVKSKRNKARIDLEVVAEWFDQVKPANLSKSLSDDTCERSERSATATSNQSESAPLHDYDTARLPVMEPVAAPHKPEWMFKCNKAASGKGPRKVNNQVLRRRRRSIASGQVSTGSNSKVALNSKYHVGEPTSALLFKKPNKSTKKTTFASKFHDRRELQNYAPSKVKSADPKRRFLLAPNTIQDIIVGSISTESSVQRTSLLGLNQPTFPADQVKDLRELIDSMFTKEARLSWHISAALNTLNNSREVAQKLFDSQRDESNKLKAMNMTRARQVENLQLEWLPAMSQLIVDANHSLVGGFYSDRTRQLVANLTHYIEFFSVALEQLHFEQQVLARESANAYKELKNNLLWMICELKFMMNLSRTYSDEYKSFSSALQKLTSGHSDRAALLGQQLGDSASYFNVLVQHEKSHDRRHTDLIGDGMRSPLAQFFEQTRRSQRDLVAQMHAPEVTGDFSNGSNVEYTWIIQPQNKCTAEHVGREVMPLAIRRLRSDQERAVRDELILDRMLHFFASAESLLLSNFV